MLKEKLTITYNLDEVADSLDEGIRFLIEHDISSAEIRTIDGNNIANLTLEETELLRKKLNTHGITISAIASPLFKWYPQGVTNDSKADLFGMSPFLSIEKKQEMIKKVISQAVILKTQRIRIFSGLKEDQMSQGLPQEESDLILYALEVAKENGVQLMLENEPVCHVSRLEDYINIFTSGKYPGLRAWFDIANVYEEGQLVTMDSLKALEPYIDYIHVKDPIAFQAHEYTILGQGYINYKRIFSALNEIITSPLHLSIETHVKTDKWNASHNSLLYLHDLINTKRVGYAIVGTGRISKKHLNALQSNENSTLVGVFDIDTKRSSTVAMEYDCEQYLSYEELLKDSQVNAISICTPHNTHIQLASQAFDFGKNILCEKPLALNAKDLLKYISEVDTDNKTHIVFQNKFNPAVKQFYNYEKSELGDPQYIAMTLRWWRDVDYYQDWHGNYDVSGGPLITQAIHSLELVTHLTKSSKIKSISAKEIRTREDISLPDIIVAIIEFDNGVLCNIEVCVGTKHQNLESSLFVVGTKGSVKIGGVALSEFAFPIKTGGDNLGLNQDYYGNGHTALYKTLSNYYLKNTDDDSNLLTRPADIIPTIQLIEGIEACLYSKSKEA